MSEPALGSNRLGRPSRRRVTLGYKDGVWCCPPGEAVAGAYRFTAAEAARVDVLFEGAPSAVRVTELSYYYPGMVTFDLPDAVSGGGDQRDVLAGRTNLTLYDAGGDVVLSSGLEVTGGSSSERGAISVSLGLLYDVWCRNLLGTF